eukprot:jgi/Hompol1/1892/HPOL_002788-RA
MISSSNTTAAQEQPAPHVRLAVDAIHSAGAPTDTVLSIATDHDHDHDHDYDHDQCGDSSHNHNHNHNHSDATNSSDGRPVRAILTKDDLERFQQSDAYADFMRFVLALNDAARNKTLRDPCVTTSPSTIVSSLLALLDILDTWCIELPPDESSKSRFGNPTFQLWYDRLEANVEHMLDDIIPANLPNSIAIQPDPSSNPSRELIVREVSTYLLHSFGNRKRIDYGTGHEAHFIAFLLCLDKLGLFVPDRDYSAIVLGVFWRYISVMRSLQFHYWLEPAGSHGVWGLDDYHFLPFMFGSSQLLGKSNSALLQLLKIALAYYHKHFRPKSIHDADILSEYSKDYMYFACIKFINSVKTASLRWHSPMLDDISGVKKWSKVNEGMIKMYKAEVLAKLPIMQHFLFGTLIPFQGSVFDPNLASEHHGHDHVHAFGQEAPVCCGMRVPSAIAAGLAEQRGGAPRPLPFD